MRQILKCGSEVLSYSPHWEGTNLKIFSLMSLTCLLFITLGAVAHAALLSKLRHFIARDSSQICAAVEGFCEQF
jgi:hypothetical protein